jgi:hypothetical protein
LKVSGGAECWDFWDFSWLLVYKKTTRKVTRRQEEEEDQEEGKILITFGNKKEANDSVATGILPQYGDPHWG